jgi:four helix bundle protein
MGIAPTWPMSRDHRKLAVFDRADGLVLRVYAATSSFPVAERFGLQSQIRRACVSVPTNIVEGSAREAEGDYCRFIHIARASARETEYLLSLARRLDLLVDSRARELEGQYDVLQRMLRRLVDGLREA